MGLKRDGCSVVIDSCFQIVDVLMEFNQIQVVIVL